MKILSPSNPTIKMWSCLLQRKGRLLHKKFLVEGIHLVEELLDSTIPVESFVYSLERGIPAELTKFKQVEWIGVSEAAMLKCSDTKTPQGVFAVVPMLRCSLSSLFVKDGLVVAVDRMQDPGNLGTIIRSADAIGASGVFVGQGSVDMYHPKTVRASMGSMFHLPIIEGDLNEVLPHARRQGMRIVGSMLEADCAMYDIDWKESIWLIIGNEASGISQEINAHMDVRVQIPMPGAAESLNAAMAATVLLYEALRHRNAVPTMD